MTARYYEDFSVGEVFITAAGLSGDFNPLHTDEESARLTQFGRRIAHGPLGIAVLVGLLARLGHLEGTAIAMLGLEWSFRRPIFIGDTVHARVSIESMKESKQPDRGVIVRHIELLNQEGEVVQQGRLPVLVRKRVVGNAS
jgi:acyl dehydratase